MRFENCEFLEEEFVQFLHFEETTFEPTHAEDAGFLEEGPMRSQKERFVSAHEVPESLQGSQADTLTDFVGDSLKNLEWYG
jgi:hypothetical protein